MGIHGNGIAVDATATGIGVLAFVYMLYILVVGGIGIGSYVLQGLAYYRIATRRGIKHAWLAWLPVGSAWILGCISDQYQYVVKRQIKNKRKVLLILGIAMAVAAVLIAAILGNAVGSLISLGLGQGYGAEVVSSTLLGVFGIAILTLVISGLSIATVILQYICLYDLYSSCDPSNNITYLILSIFLGFLMPVLLFLCRNKDEGMPPRKVNPTPISVEPAAWESTQPQGEPWENPENQE